MGQFRVEWLQSRYRDAEWGYSVEFFRLEGYTPGVYFAREYLSFCASHTLYSPCLPLLLAGARVKEFDRSPKGYVNLSPGFWSLALWKSTIFMHHNIDVLQQVH